LFSLGKGEAGGRDYRPPVNSSEFLVSFDTDELFEKALRNSLRDFIHTSGVKDEKKRCLRTVKKEVFGILYTGFGKSVIFQILPRVIKVLCKLERTIVLIRHLKAKRM